MIIREMSPQACIELLRGSRLGRLACAHERQPYVVPISFAYHVSGLYCVTTLGQKVEWMRANPSVALQVDRIQSAQRWESVIVYGRYEEFSDTPDTRAMRELAWSLLQSENELWWEPAYVETITEGGKRPTVPIYFRISVARITGHRASVE